MGSGDSFKGNYGLGNKWGILQRRSTCMILGGLSKIATWGFRKGSPRKNLEDDKENKVRG